MAGVTDLQERLEEGHVPTVPDEATTEANTDTRRLFGHGLYWLVAVAIIGSLYSISSVKNDFVIWGIAFGSVFFLSPWAVGQLPKESESSCSASPKPRARLYYLDNLKVFLTGMVVVHHICCGLSIGGADGINLGGGPGKDWFRACCTGLMMFNQSFFMVLFMFISGYFTPQSYDRKGPFLFLQDKMKRLALPLLFWVFVLNPLLVLFLQRIVAHNESFAEYHNGMGPPWFIKALIVYNVCYALAAGMEPVKMPLPNFWTIAGLNVLASIVEIVLFAVGFNDLIGFAGGVVSSGAVQTLAFFAGCVAYRNQWLETLLEMQRERGHAGRTYLRASLCGLVMFVCGVYMNYSLSDGKFTSASYMMLAIMVGSSGYVGTSLNLAMLDFFSRFFGNTSRLSKLLSTAAYTVYLIHPFVWSLVLWSYVKILETMGFTLLFEMVGDTPTNQAPLSAVVLAEGWLYTVLLSLIVLWPLAWCIAKLPGLRKVL